MLANFANEPLTDFAQEENRHRMHQALRRVRAQLGARYGLRIGGKTITGDQWITSTNPASPNEIVGYVTKATAEHAELALKHAAASFAAWSHTAHAQRARHLLKAAWVMRHRRFELSAWEILEIGKPWAEADADIAEAIDFLEYYGREMMRLAEPQPVVRIVGEENELGYEPLGIGLIIPPWNFPLAILTGMTSAALVTGNTVVLKPASITPVVAAKFVEIMESTGLPDGVLNFVPGSGGEIGDLLVDSPKTRFISFTGSREVGLRINERAAKTPPGQRWIKRVVAEMGGKDATVVDETADLEAAAHAIVTAAFGFQGQKCSACSRAILVASIYDQVLERVIALTRQLRLGPPEDPASDLGPVSDEGAFKKIKEYLQVGKTEGRLVTGGHAVEGPGYFIEPTIFADVASQARIAQEEIFGPILAVLKARDFDHALEIANDTVYGLTGAVFSARRDRLELARREFHVGNLYLNRKCTGALVGVQPFGGFDMSGTDSKAGGQDYLKLFMQAKSVAEKLAID